MGVSVESIFLRREIYLMFWPVRFYLYIAPTDHLGEMDSFNLYVSLFIQKLQTIWTLILCKYFDFDQFYCINSFFSSMCVFFLAYSNPFDAYLCNQYRFGVHLLIIDTCHFHTRATKYFANWLGIYHFFVVHCVKCESHASNEFRKGRISSVWWYWQRRKFQFSIYDKHCLAFIAIYCSGCQ